MKVERPRLDFSTDESDALTTVLLHAILQILSVVRSVLQKMHTKCVCSEM